MTHAMTDARESQWEKAVSLNFGDKNARLSRVNDVDTLAERDVFRAVRMGNSYSVPLMMAGDNTKLFQYSATLIYAEMMDNGCAHDASHPPLHLPVSANPGMYRVRVHCYRQSLKPFDTIISLYSPAISLSYTCVQYGYPRTVSRIL